MHSKYLQEKLREIESEVAIAAAGISFSVMYAGKVTDVAIQLRDEATENIQKIVMQILKHERKV